MRFFTSQEELADTSPELKLISDVLEAQADFDDKIPFEKQKFDFITMLDVIEHVVDPKKLIGHERLDFPKGQHVVAILNTDDPQLSCFNRVIVGETEDEEGYGSIPVYGETQERAALREQIAGRCTETDVPLESTLHILTTRDVSLITNRKSRVPHEKDFQELLKEVKKGKKII